MSLSSCLRDSRISAEDAADIRKAVRDAGGDITKGLHDHLESLHDNVADLRQQLEDRGFSAPARRLEAPVAENTPEPPAAPEPVPAEVPQPVIHRAADLAHAAGSLDVGDRVTLDNGNRFVVTSRTPTADGDAVLGLRFHNGVETTMHASEVERSMQPRSYDDAKTGERKVGPGATIERGPMFKARDAAARGEQPAPIEETHGVHVAPEFSARADTIVRNLRAELNRLGLKDVGARLVGKIQQVVNGEATAMDGLYLKKLITIAMDTANKGFTFDHESIHAMRDLGLFSDPEWATLEKAVTGNEELWAKTQAMYPELLRDKQIEEGVANLYAGWQQAKGATNLPRGLFVRMRAFVQGIGRVLTRQGFHTPESIFQSIDRGEVGARERAAPERVEPRLGEPEEYGPHAAPADENSPLFAKRAHLTPPASMDENIASGSAAIERALADKSDAPDALFRKAVGWISVLWGDEKGGLQHILLHRAKEGADGEGVIRALPEVIAKGQFGTYYLGANDPTKVMRNITYKGRTAVLAAERHGKRLDWVLTAFDGEKEIQGKGTPISDREAADRIARIAPADAPTSVSMARRGATQSGLVPDVRPSLGAAGDSNILPKAAPGKPEPKFSKRDPKTTTPEFRRWFGESKVVDEKGGPLAVYHGSIKRFGEFTHQPAMRRDDMGHPIEVQPQAFFFATDPAAARVYAQDRSEIDKRLRGGNGGRPEVRPFYLSARNPLDFTIDRATRDQMLKDGYPPFFNRNAPSPYALREIEEISHYEPQTWADVQAALDDPHVVSGLRERGFDSAKLNEENGSESWAVFDPTQVKSATGNRGTFDPNDPRVAFSKRGNAPEGGKPWTDKDTADYGEARQSTVARKSTFDSGAVGKVTRLAPAGDHKMPDEQVAARFVNTGTTKRQDLRDFIAAVGDRPTAMNTLQDYLASKLRETAIKKDGTLDLAKFRIFGNKYAHAIEEFPELAGKFKTAAAAQLALDATTVRADGEQKLINDVAKQIKGNVIAPDGSWKPKDYEKWLHNNASRIAQFPDLKAAFDTADAAQKTLRASRAVAKDERAELTKSAAAKFLNTADPVATMGQMFGADVAKSKAQILQLTSQVAEHPDAREGLKRLTMDWITKKFMTGPENEEHGAKSIKAAAFKAFVSEYAGVLKPVLGYDGVAVLKSVAEDLGRNARSYTAFKIAGSPGTAQDLTAAAREHGGDSIMGAIFSHATKGIGLLALLEHTSLTKKAIAIVGRALISRNIRNTHQLMVEMTLDPARFHAALQKIPASPGAQIAWANRIAFALSQAGARQDRQEKRKRA